MTRLTWRRRRQHRRNQSIGEMAAAAAKAAVGRKSYRKRGFSNIESARRKKCWQSAHLALAKSKLNIYISSLQRQLHLRLAVRRKEGEMPASAAASAAASISASSKRGVAYIAAAAAKISETGAIRHAANKGENRQRGNRNRRNAQREEKLAAESHGSAASISAGGVIGSWRLSAAAAAKKSGAGAAAEAMAWRQYRDGWRGEAVGDNQEMAAYGNRSANAKQRVHGCMRNEK